MGWPSVCCRRWRRRCRRAARWWRWSIIRWPARRDSPRTRCEQLPAQRTHGARRRAPRRSPPAESTADLLVARFDVPPSSIDVILPGTDRVPFSVGSGGRAAATAVGRRDRPRKGFDLLVEALARLADLAVASHDRRRPDPRSGGGRGARCSDRAPPPRTIGSTASVRFPPNALPRSTPVPTCSCWRRTSRGTAWPTPRRSRTACR